MVGKMMTQHTKICATSCTFKLQPLPKQTAEEVNVILTFGLGPM
jgi:hypothetical protein